MKVVHIPFCYWPDPVGGTEVYVQSLAKEQQRQGLDIVVAAPGKLNAEYWHDGLRVRRFAVNQKVEDLQELYGEGDPRAAEEIGRILDEESPDLVHQHALTRGASLRLVREAKRRGLPVVFSYHTPTVSCQRGTLLRWGSEVCGGTLDVNECTRCALHGHGLNRFSSTAAGSIPTGVGRVLGALGASGGFWTAARMTELVRLRHAMFRNLIAEVDHVIGLCQWVKDVLVRNDVPEAKITVSRQGLDDQQVGVSSLELGTERRTGQSAVRIAFLGRLDPTKGVHVLIEALKRNPALDIRLDIFGVVQEGAGEEYQRRLMTLAGTDERIGFQQPISSDQVVVRLKDYDLLAVSSQGLETGPRVVLEAFAARIPVIGSNLGGIAELVQHGVNGLLVEPQSIEAWADGFTSVCYDPELLPRLRAGVRAPRGMRAVADEMRVIYMNVLQTLDATASLSCAT